MFARRSCNSAAASGCSPRDASGSPRDANAHANLLLSWFVIQLLIHISSNLNSSIIPSCWQIQVLYCLNFKLKMNVTLNLGLDMNLNQHLNVHLDWKCAHIYGCESEYEFAIVTWICIWVSHWFGVWVPHLCSHLHMNLHFHLENCDEFWCLI